jgi:hypothetical protein
MKELAKKAVRPVRRLLRYMVRDSGIARAAGKLNQKLSDYKTEARWRRNGCPAPPPAAFKRRFLRNLAKRNRLQVFVETGTLHGDTVDALKGDFLELHSIELDNELFLKAQARFRDSPNVYLHKGNSGEELPKILAQLRQPALVWLDAHYSGPGTALGTEDTPVLKELAAVSAHPFKHKHVIVIDDARDFLGVEIDGYPRLDEIRSYASSIGFNSYRLAFDMIVLKQAAKERQHSADR